MLDRKPRKTNVNARKRADDDDIVVYEKETITADEKRRIKQGGVDYGTYRLIVEEANSRILWRWETHEAELCHPEPVVRSRLVVRERDGVVVAERRPVVVDYTTTGRVRRRVPYHIMELMARELRAGIVSRSKTALKIRHSKNLSDEEKDELLTLLYKVP